MSIISKKLGDENRVSNSVQRFLQNYKVAYLLRKCGITKIKGRIVKLSATIFRNKLHMVFYSQGISVDEGLVE